MDYEAWTEHQLREAAARGDFDDLPGSGRPIPDLDKPHDELWWVKQKLRRENVSFLPPSLQARKQAEDALVAAAQAGSEAEVRRIVGAANERIRAVLRNPPSGPPFNLMPYDIDRIVERWRTTRRELPAARLPAEEPDSGRPVRFRWWRRTS